MCAQSAPDTSHLTCVSEAATTGATDNGGNRVFARMANGEQLEMVQAASSCGDKGPHDRAAALGKGIY